jgi:tryptophan synthase beta chain
MKPLSARKPARREPVHSTINYSGHENFDLSGYDQYLEGKLLDYAYPEEEVKRSIAKLPRITFPGK